MDSQEWHECHDWRPHAIREGEQTTRIIQGSLAMTFVPWLFVLVSAFPVGARWDGPGWHEHPRPGRVCYCVWYRFEETGRGGWDSHQVLQLLQWGHYGVGDLDHVVRKLVCSCPKLPTYFVIFLPDKSSHTHAYNLTMPLKPGHFLPEYSLASAAYTVFLFKVARE